MPVLPTNRSANDTAIEHIADHNTLADFHNDHPTDPAAHSGTYERLATFNVKAYGAIGDGATDDTAAINAAVQAANAAGGGTVYAPIGTYLLSSGLTLLERVILAGAGPYLTTFKLASGQTVTAQGTGLAWAAPTTTLSADADANDTTITVASTAAFSAGDYAVLADSALPNPGGPTNRNGEMIRVRSVDSATQITVAGVIRDTYTTARSAALFRMVPLVGPGLRDAAFVSAAPTTNTTQLVNFAVCVGVNISNCFFSDSAGPGLSLRNCIDTLVSRVRAEDLLDDPGSGMLGYGIQVLGACDNVIIEASEFRRCRHGVTTGGSSNPAGVPRNLLVTGCTASETTEAAFDTHQHGGQITFSGNQVVGGRSDGFQVRSPDTRIIGNSISRMVGTGIHISDNPHGAVIADNIIRHCDEGIFLNAGTPDGVAIEGNTIDAVRNAGILIDDDATQLVIARNRIYNTGLATPSAGIVFDTGVTSTGHRIERNSGGNYDTASEPGVAPGAMTDLVSLPATVTASYIVGNTAVGLSGSVVNDAGSNVKIDNLALDAPTASETDAAVLLADNLTSGEETYSRRWATQTTVSTGAGTLRLTYFTARKTETINSVRVYSGGTAAGATPTLARIGVYSVAANGDLTLVASTANDTTLFAGANTAYTKALSAPWSKVAGRRYAIGPLVVTGATAPTVVGYSAGNAAEAGIAPRVSGAVTGQTDLPASVAVGSVVSSGSTPYFAMVP
ncbi:MAG TPA: glycosyl hydrolase family 28-related protein [Acidimicrobiia bacterium]|nr:glycosyl hydrolase family 28-related protein [Acidimicrobiia bacterium]